VPVLITVALAATFGGAYGCVVGAIAGFGGVLVPHRGRARRTAVYLLTVAAIGITLVAMYYGAGGWPYAGPGLGYLVVSTVVAWFTAPLLDGRRPDWATGPNPRDPGAGASPVQVRRHDAS